MTITIETSDMQEVEQLLILLKSLNIKSISIKDTSVKRQPVIDSSDKKLNPRELFGLWQGSPRTLTNIHPKLPMRDKAATKDFYVNKLGFQNLGSADFDGYLMVEKDNIEIHFFEFKELDPKNNYGQVYIRTDDIENLYRSLLHNNVNIHPNGKLQAKPWGQIEFSLLDPDNNLLTFGQSDS